MSRVVTPGAATEASEGASGRSVRALAGFPTPAAAMIYLFAFLYFSALTVGFFINKVQSGDFFSQTALVLAGVGLYNADPPSKGSQSPAR